MYQTGVPNLGRRLYGLGMAAVICAAYLAGRGSRPSVVVNAGGSPRPVLYYVDPMHPSYRSERPGKAPDCGMDLEPVYAGAEPSPADGCRQRSPHTGAGAVRASRDRDRRKRACRPYHSNRGPRRARRGPYLSNFRRRRWMGAPRVLRPHGIPREARRSSSAPSTAKISPRRSRPTSTRWNPTNA